MEGLERVRIRPAAAGDADSIARLHAESWRRHYRGAYSDAFLDGDVLQDRLSVWRDRLDRAGAEQHTVVATATARVVGFAHRSSMQTRPGARCWTTSTSVTRMRGAASGRGSWR